MQATATTPIQLTKMLQEHYPHVKAIYEAGIATGNATMETQAPTWEAWDESHLKSCRLVALQGEQVVGWAALSPVSGRCIFSGVAEVSVYVYPAFQGRGIGKQLLRKLVQLSEEEGIWTLQAGILTENKASIKLHEQTGFRKVGVRERIGKLNGEWRDICLLERRSHKVGI